MKDAATLSESSTTPYRLRLFDDEIPLLPVTLHSLTWVSRLGRSQRFLGSSIAVPSLVPREQGFALRELRHSQGFAAAFLGSPFDASGVKLFATAFAGKSLLWPESNFIVMASYVELPGRGPRWTQFRSPLPFPRIWRMCLCRCASVRGLGVLMALSLAGRFLFRTERGFVASPQFPSFKGLNCIRIGEESCRVGVWLGRHTCYMTTQVS